MPHRKSNAAVTFAAITADQILALLMSYLESASWDLWRPTRFLPSLIKLQLCRNTVLGYVAPITGFVPDPTTPDFENFAGAGCRGAEPSDRDDQEHPGATRAASLGKTRSQRSSSIGSAGSVIERSTIGLRLIAKTHRREKLPTDRTIHAHVMCAFVCADCETRSRPHDSIDRAAVVTCSCQSTLHLHNNRAAAVGATVNRLIIR